MFYYLKISHIPLGTCLAYCDGRSGGLADRRAEGRTDGWAYVQRQWTQKSTLFAISTSMFWPLWWSKKSLSGLFVPVLDFFKKWLGINYGRKKAYFLRYFHLKKFLNDPDNRNFLSKTCSFWQFWWAIFDRFGGQKSCFLDFFKVVLQLFKKCLDNVFGHNRLILVLFSAPKVDKWPQQSRF